MKTKDHAEANAKLRAAAPDLLEACQFALAASLGSPDLTQFGVQDPKDSSTPRESLDNLLATMERLRESKQNSDDTPDYIIRLCEAIVAEAAGYKNRYEWRHLQRIA